MGGAQGSAGKPGRKRTAGARAVAQARGAAGPDKRIIAAVVAVLLLAGIVIGGVVWTNASKNSTAGQTITPQTVGAALDSVGERQGASVVSGKADAKVKLDIYEDFLCPYCAQLQQSYGDQIEQQIQAGKLRVTYHMIPLLTTHSDPPGYSLDSANAALCAADEGKFTAFHDSLYKDQPKEGERGFDNSQLIKLGQDLGITSPQFPTCVNAGTYNQQLNAALQETAQNPNFHGTPAVFHNGTPVALTPDWLTNLINQA